MRPSLLPALLLAACPDPTPQCGSTQGFVTGVVTGADAIKVYATDQEGERVEASAASDGSYELNLEGGRTWVISASGSVDEGGDTGAFGTTCYAPDQALEVDACEEYTLNLSLTECITADKPNLYLYPAADTPTRVTLRHDPRQIVFASAPPYEGQWTGTAHPDGTFTPRGGARAPFLFYEITVLPAQSKRLQRTEVICVPGEGAVQAMADLLGSYGFNARERADFVTGWQHDLPARPSYAVYPQRAVEHVVGLDLSPAIPVQRLWLLVEDGAGCKDTGIKPAPLPRGGAHGVEWGVVLDGLR